MFSRVASLQFQALLSSQSRVKVSVLFFLSESPVA